MRSTALLFAALFGLSAFATGCAAGADDAGTAPAASSDSDLKSTKILLDCNVFLSGGGPDQQVTVVQTADGLVLKELTNHGSMIERPLSAEEWASKDLTLTADPDDFGASINRLYFEKGDWMNESKSDGWHAMGMADCSNTDR